ncbi:MAG TPA: transglycosylase domain-containing protein [Brumimicrobium sp.]|nr:transglycosylase domain-containing protein [Brumimicrobium sp.]
MNKKKKKILKKSIFALVANAIILPTLLLLSVYFGGFGELQTKEGLKNIQSYVASEVLAEDGNVLGKYYWENRSKVAYDQIPPIVVQALIATEDARFYEHNGVDAIGLLRVFFKSLLMGDKSAGGGSTIGQQLSKNLFKRENHGLFSMPVNKIKEAIHAVRFNSVYTQEEVLGLYLNTVSVGEDTYGIKNATLRFFNKPLDSLKTEEAAVLIGMLKSPTAYNPRLHPERSTARRNLVLNNLIINNYISKEVGDSLKDTPLTLDYKNTGRYGDVAPYFLVQIEEQTNRLLKDIKKPNGESYDLYRDGLKISTAINYEMQLSAVAAVQKQMKALQRLFDRQWKEPSYWNYKNKIVNREVKKSSRYENLKAAKKKDAEIEKIFNTPQPMELFDWEESEATSLSPLDSIKYYLKILHSGFLAMEPTSGEIKAWVGGNDYRYFQYDHVTSKRQVGSTFKPIVYATAIEQGLDPCEYISNEREIYDEYEGWSPRNADNEYGGKYSVKGALANSVNVISVDVLFKAGIENVMQTAHNLGIHSDIPEVPSIALGVANISLLEMVNAYCAFANGGKNVSPVFITRIENSMGEVIYEPEATPPKKVISNQTAYTMTEMLRGVVNEGTANRLRTMYSLHGEIAGKTGTTQSHADGWFIGYTPGLVAGAWVGADNPAVHFKSIRHGQGAATALPIWAYFMQNCKTNKTCIPYINGRFNFGNDVTPLPECESFLENNLVDKVQNWFTRDSRLQKERREKRREERKKRRNRR